MPLACVPLGGRRDPKGATLADKWARALASLGLLFLTGLLVWVSAFFFALGQGLVAGFHLVLLGLLVLSWGAIWAGRVGWAFRVAGLQILLTLVLYILEVTR